MSAPRGSFRRLLCAVLLTQSNLVIDEKFTSEDEEKDDTGEDIGKGMVKTEGRDAISRAPISRKTIRKETRIITSVLNFASHATIIAT